MTGAPVPVSSAAAPESASADRFAVVTVLLFSLAVLFALTFAAGGVQPPGRALVSVFFFGAALAACGARGVSPRLRWPLFAPAAAAALSLPLAPIPALGYELTLQLFFYAASATLLADYISNRVVITSFAAAAVLLSLSVLFEAVQNVLLSGPAGLAQGAAGFLLGANVTATLLAASLTPLWWLFEQRKISRAAAFALGAVVAAGIVLTQSRTGWIAAACGLVVPFSRMTPRRRARVVAFGLLLLAAGALAYVPRFLAKLDPGYITNMQRWSMMRGVSEAFRDAPWLGFGPWSFPVIGQRYLTWPKWELHPHSLPLRVLFETGLVGVFAWLACLWSGLRKVPSRPADAIAFGVVAAILGGSITDDVLWIPFASMLFFTALGAGIPGPLIRARAAYAVLPALGLMACGLLPLAHAAWPGGPLEPVSLALVRAVTEDRIPDFAGWREDPTALRATAYKALHRGDTRVAENFLRAAHVADSRMIFVPTLFDLAWLRRADGRETDAEMLLREARLVAPVLTARFSGETEPVVASWLDRHYGIEFPEPSAISAGMLEPVNDVLDWRHYRYEGAQALASGDTERARDLLRRAWRLGTRQYGTDPVLCRFLAEAFPENAANWRARAAARDGAAFPYRVFAPLIFRQPVTGDVENSPWWKDRMERPRGTAR